MSGLVPENSDMAATPGNQRRLKQTKAQVEEVVEIVRINVDKMLERDQKLSELDHRVEVLQAGASQFSTTARKVKRKYWWKNCKILLILITVIILILLVIIIWRTTLS